MGDMDSRMVGHAQRRRIGAASNVYDPAEAEFDAPPQKTDEDYEREAAKREFDYFQEEDERKRGLR